MEAQVSAADVHVHVEGSVLSEAIFAELFVSSDATASLQKQLRRLVSEGPSMLPPPSPSSSHAAEAAKLVQSPLLQEADLQKLHTLLQRQLTSGDMGTSLPGLRRTVIAAIIWQRLQGAAWSLATQAVVVAICTDLAALHKAAASRKVNAHINVPSLLIADLMHPSRITLLPHFSLPPQ